MPRGCAVEEEEIFPTVGRPTALVADDSWASLEAIAGMLECSGFAVFTAGSIREGERVAERLTGPLDLLVTGAMLASAGGDGLVRLVRARGLDPAVLYTSEEPPARLHDRGFRVPDASLIRKPFTDTELAGRVRILLGL